MHSKTLCYVNQSNRAIERVTIRFLGKDSYNVCVELIECILLNIDPWAVIIFDTFRTSSILRSADVVDDLGCMCGGL